MFRGRGPVCRGVAQIDIWELEGTAVTQHARRQCEKGQTPIACSDSVNEPIQPGRNCFPICLPPTSFAQHLHAAAETMRKSSVGRSLLRRRRWTRMRHGSGDRSRGGCVWSTYILRSNRATTEKEDDRNARFRPHSQPDFPGSSDSLNGLGNLEP